MKESSTPPWGGRGRGVLDEGDTGEVNGVVGESHERGWRCCVGKKEAFCFIWKDLVSW